jgi:hypothetical protein
MNRRDTGVNGQITCTRTFLSADYAHYIFWTGPKTLLGNVAASGKVARPLALLFLDNDIFWTTTCIFWTTDGRSCVVRDLG